MADFARMKGADSAAVCFGEAHPRAISVEARKNASSDARETRDQSQARHVLTERDRAAPFS